jgi:hypothetical protein
MRAPEVGAHIVIPIEATLEPGRFPRSHSRARDDESVRPIAFAGLLLCIAAFWMIQHPYERIVHDSVLYAFAALARLHPRSLGQDPYLTVGVQDRYTLFSPLAAAVIRLVGLTRAASLITLAAQIGFFGCVALLARRLMPPALAIVSVALLVMLPTTYGDRYIFSYAEPFMTPRLPAEALVLAGLAAALYRRRILAVLLLCAATLLHPIMAAAGVALLWMLYIGLPRPRLALSLGFGGLALLAGVAWLAPLGPFSRFDKGWFDLLYADGAYLFPSRWGLVDWVHASVPLTTLTVGAVTATQRHIRSLCLAALLTGLAGLALSLLGADLAHIVIVAQAQPWRWLWLANVMAVVLTPIVCRDCWRREGGTRSVVVLLAAAWVSIDALFAPLLGLSAIVVAAAGRRLTDPRHARLLLAGACAALGLGLLVLAHVVIGVVRDVALMPPDPTLYSSAYLLELRRVKPWQAGGIAPAALFLLAWWTVTHRKDLGSAVAVLALGTALCGACAQFAWNSWISWPRGQIPARLYAEFAPWRGAIPEASQVLWGGTAFPTWFLLHRPSYWSRDQTAASVFSEALTREILRRQWTILSIERSTGDPHRILIRTCRDNPALGYFVSPADAGPTPYPIIGNPRGRGAVRLYRCADYRAG